MSRWVLIGGAGLTGLKIAEELIEMKDYLHRILNDRLSAVKAEYMSLDNRINNPDLYALSGDEIMDSF